MRILRYADPSGQIRFASQQPDGTGLEIDGDVFGQFTVSSRRANIAKLLAPVDPKAFFCIGLNYRKHAEEGKSPIPQWPVLFMKNPGAVQNPGDPIVLPTKLKSTQVDYECELAVVIGKPCKNATKENALDFVLGYTCGNDVSARDWQKDFGGSQWCRGKTFDTFAPLGPALVLKDEIPNPNALQIKTILNGETMQDWTTGDMIFDVPTLIAFLSGSTTLHPGTVIMTGTPHGVGAARKPPVFLKSGDSITIEIEKIGKLTNPVVEEA
ncbi:MAG: fumarylacetoacetate hydrolase family protein [Pirellulaceae bacterium]|nr:fumarylacetoacetate hydrolase family protein [Pirellulaceae bacterium]